MLHVDTSHLSNGMDYDIPIQRRLTKKIFAKAIYDNLADSPDELQFKKGDILNVIEQDTEGLEGWWLCSIQRPGGYTMQGICPGNRLRIMNSYDSGFYSTSSLSSLSTNTSLAASTVTLNSSILSNQDNYDVPEMKVCYHSSCSCKNNPNNKIERNSWNYTPKKIETQEKYNDVYDLCKINRINDLNNKYNKGNYKNFSTNMSTESSASGSENYDIPKSSNNIYNNKLNISIDETDNENYDIPKPINLLQQQATTPNSSTSSVITSDLGASNRSSLILQDYDIPKKHPTVSMKKDSITSMISLYDFPQCKTPTQLNDKYHHAQIPKELPLELSSALETLNSMQNESSTVISKILSYVGPHWRSRHNLSENLMDFKLFAHRLKTSLHDLHEFSNGALGNAARVDDKTLILKLRPLVKALQNHYKIITDSLTDLDKRNWNIESLIRDDLNANYSPDSLDQFIACVQKLIEDVRVCISFIFGNAKLLFKRIQSTPVNTPTEWSLQDYDYVCFESKDYAAKKNSDLRNAIPHGLQKNFDIVLDKATNLQIRSECIDINDKLILKYYTAQICTHFTYLSQAIDNFLKTVEKNQPPKYFLAHGKFVILSAHNLVSIGDIVAKNLQKQDFKIRIQQFTDSLADALQNCVNKSKMASQNFPQTEPVQHMVDSVVEISHTAQDMRKYMLQCAEQAA